MKEKKPGEYSVIQYESAHGTRYRVNVSMHKLRGVYGGTFTNPVEAAKVADRIRYWVYRHGLVLREPVLNFPEDYTDPDKIPTCPLEVTAIVDKIAEGKRHEVTFSMDYKTLVGHVLDLQARVAALEANQSGVAAPKKPVGPEKISLVP